MNNIFGNFFNKTSPQQQTPQQQTPQQQTPQQQTSEIKQQEEECRFDIITTLLYKNNKYYINDIEVAYIKIFYNGKPVNDITSIDFINKCPIKNLKLLSKKDNIYEFIFNLTDNEKYNIVFILKQQIKVVGGNKKYKLTKEKVNILNKNKKITRSIYIDSKKNKFIKIDNVYKILNKCKIVK